jgi:hypothetical protein
MRDWMLDHLFTICLVVALLCLIVSVLCFTLVLVLST